MGYRDVYAGWKADPESYWLEAAKGIDWVKAPTRALNDARAPLYEWFTDATVNTCWNAVDRHVEAGRGNQLAIIHESPVTHLRKGITYRELQTRVANLAGALRAKGVGKGDRVIIYMPMVPEALEAMAPGNLSMRLDKPPINLQPGPYGAVSGRCSWAIPCRSNPCSPCP